MGRIGTAFINLRKTCKEKKTGDLGDNCLANERTHNNEVLWSSSTERVVE